MIVKNPKKICQNLQKKEKQELDRKRADFTKKLNHLLTTTLVDIEIWTKNHTTEQDKPTKSINFLPFVSRRKHTKSIATGMALQTKIKTETKELSISFEAYKSFAQQFIASEQNNSNQNSLANSSVSTILMQDILQVKSISTKFKKITTPFDNILKKYEEKEVLTPTNLQKLATTTKKNTRVKPSQKSSVKKSLKNPPSLR